MAKVIKITEEQLKQMVKEAVHRKLRSDETATTQLDLFGPAYNETTITRPKRVTPQQKEARKQEKKEQKALEKKLKAEKDFEDAWKKRGVIQGRLFDEDGI